MSRHKPLTDAERMIRKVRAESDADSNWPSSLAYECLRYEATLQAKDEQIAALTAQLEAESDIQYAQRSTNERLLAALREITEMTVCDALGERYARAQATAYRAIKEATHGS